MAYLKPQPHLFFLHSRTQFIIAQSCHRDWRPANVLIPDPVAILRLQQGQMWPELKDEGLKNLEAEFTRITQENEQLKDRNKNLELEVAGMKAVSDEHVKRIKALQEENATYVARIATLEERIRQDKEKLNRHCKILRDLVNEWDQEESL